MTNEDPVERLRSRLLRGDLSDVSFDKLLSSRERAKSKEFWSPLCVARRAASRFAEHGARRVLDVGAGPGKFCIAAALTRPNGFYLFNPFAENEYDPSNTFDDTVLLSKHRLRAELLQLATLLSSIPTGSLIVTYCRLGGPIPSSFDLVSEEPVGSGPLRTWLNLLGDESA